MPKLGKVGNGVVKRSRGKSVFALKKGGTTLIGGRGKRVSVEDKNRILTTSTSGFDRAFKDEKQKFKKTISRRGKTAGVLKRVRSH